MSTSELEFEHQLKEALDAYCGGLLRSIPTDEILEQSQAFSSKFERDMEYLLLRQQNPPRRLHHVFAKRIALIALTVALAATSLMSVEAIRIPVLRFFTEVHETFTRIVFGGEDEQTPLPEEIQQVYLPSFLPEGFTQDSELFDPSFVIVSYVNGTDYFEWSQYTHNFAHHVNTEGVTLETLERDGKSYLYYSQQGQQTLIWEEGGYSFLCSGNLSKEVLLQIVTSLEIKH